MERTSCILQPYLLNMFSIEFHRVPNLRPDKVTHLFIFINIFYNNYHKILLIVCSFCSWLCSFVSATVFLICLKFTVLYITSVITSVKTEYEYKSLHFIWSFSFLSKSKLFLNCHFSILNETVTKIVVDKCEFCKKINK